MCTMVTLKSFKWERRSIVIALVVVCILGAYVSGIFFRMYDNRPHSYMERAFGGIVVDRSLETIAVKDARGLTRNFLLTQDTKVMKGRDATTTDALAVGMFVLVENTPVTNGESEAVSIRLITEGNIRLPKKSQP